MPGLFRFNFDAISFWLGFIAASLFWWAFNNFKRYFPKIGKTLVMAT